MRPFGTPSTTRRKGRRQMRFWDSSALIPLIIQETSTNAQRQLLVQDQDIAFWWGSETECHSALNRRFRDGSLSIDELQYSRQLLREVLARSLEIVPTGALKASACRLLAVHPLRAADALQLAASLEWVQGNPINREIVCLDERLRQAAKQEGFTVLPA